MISPYLLTLGHLEYVLECAALNHNKEGKTELQRLVNLLESDPRFSIENRAEAVSQLREALQLYLRGSTAHATEILSSVSRSLWAPVTASLDIDKSLTIERTTELPTREKVTDHLHPLVEELSKAYKNTHTEFMSKRSIAKVTSILFVAGLILGMALAFFYDKDVRWFVKSLFDPTPLIVAAVVGALWIEAFTKKIRLQCAKDLLERLGYVIAKNHLLNVEIIKGPPEQIANSRYYDAEFINALKTGRLKESDILLDTYWIAPFGRIKKHYIWLFS